MRTLLTVILFVLVTQNVFSQTFTINSKGIVKCPSAKVGEKGTISGVTYEAVDNTLLRQRRDQGADMTKLCTSLVTDMSSLFDGEYQFNQPIGYWDVGNVTNMRRMFRSSSFNQPIGNWDVSNVSSMDEMFKDSKFNQPIGNWNVSKVNNMMGMFSRSPFNQSLNTWDVSNVKNMSMMFSNSNPTDYTFTQVYSNTPIMFADFAKNVSDNDFNSKQFQKPLWVTIGSLLDFQISDVKNSNSWVGITNPIVNDFNNDGFQDIFISFMGSENESIPFKLFLFDSISNKLIDRSSLIVDNIGQPFNRKSMTADLNGDGVLDFVAVSHPELPAKDLSYFDVVLSDRDKWRQKRIKSVSRYKNEGYYHGFALGDVDNDGDIDIVTTMWHNSDQGISTFLNDGRGNFIEKKAIVLSGDNLLEENMSFTQELFDFNNDNCLDLIYWGTQNTYIKFGNCDGTFGGNYLRLNQSFIYDYKFIDLNKDNLKDLVVYSVNNEQKIIFYQNTGSYTKPSFTKISEILVNFNTHYIDIKNLNNDGKVAIFPRKFFDGNVDQNFIDGKTAGFFPRNQILISQGDFNFKIKNYPILTPIEAIKLNVTNKKIEWVTTHLTDVHNPFLNPMVFQNLRGEIKDWIIYLSRTPFVNTSSNYLKKIIAPMNTIEKENIGNNTFKYFFPIENELYQTTYIRVGYLDMNGIESNLSYEIRIDRK